MTDIRHIARLAAAAVLARELPVPPTQKLGRLRALEPQTPAAPVYAPDMLSDEWMAAEIAKVPAPEPTTYEIACAEVAAKVEARREAMRRLADLRRAIASIAYQAVSFARDRDLPIHYRAQVEAIHKLANLRLYHIGTGVADEMDAARLRDDLRALWGIVDPLVSAIGQHAAENFNGVDVALFDRQLECALDGNATATLDAVAELITMERRR